MPAIRRKYHHGHVVLSDDEPTRTKALCGDTLDVREGDNFVKARFKGFLISHTHDGELCWVQNIIAFHPGASPYLGTWQDISRTSLLRASRLGDSVKLYLEHGALVIDGCKQIPRPKIYKDNVFSINEHRKAHKIL